ncbi:MAG: hypothetical protein M1839_005695, partial [Geoglossum umbratile]
FRSFTDIGNDPRPGFPVVKGCKGLVNRVGLSNPPFTVCKDIRFLNKNDINKRVVSKRECYLM